MLMRGWILLIVVLIWLRLTLGIIEGFDKNFKRIIPIDIEGDTLTIPPVLNNSMTFDSVKIKELTTPILTTSLKGDPNVDLKEVNANSLRMGLLMECPSDTLILQGHVTMPSLTTSNLTVQGVLRLKEWNIQTNNDLHIRNGQGIQISSDGNIHVDNRGWITNILVDIKQDRIGKINREIARLAAVAAAEAKRIADEAWQRTQNVARDTGRSIRNFFSDRRLKKNITEMSPMLDKLLSLEPKEYNWIHQTGKGFGFIAQEVHYLFPEMPKVYVDTQGDDSENPVDSEGNPIYYALDYGMFTPYLVKALQELTDKHNTELNNLQTQITNLQAEVKALSVPSA
jgi:hypothetical protein